MLSLAFFSICSPASAVVSSTVQTNRAKLKISGYGILGNRELKRMLTTLELAGKKPEFFDAGFVEDAAVILISRVKRDGFLDPEVTGQLQLADGGRLEVNADELLEKPLLRTMRVRQVHFRIRKGVLYHYAQITFEGLESVSQKQALSYFTETDTLVHLKQYKIFTPEKLKHGLSSLTEVLERKGFETANAEAITVEKDPKTGSVNVHIKVQEGQKSIVHSVREQFYDEGEEQPKETRTVFPNKPYSRIWQQDFTLALKTNQFHLGYPDTQVTFESLKRTEQDRQVELDLLAEIRSGPKTRIGEVEFRGYKKTHRSLLARRVRIKRGDLLDRIRAEDGRYRLALLGSFDSVDLNFEPMDDHTRKVIYELKEGKRVDLSLLAGYGSYELLRGGFEVEAFNLWGEAHHVRFKAIQSFKATSGDFLYTVPELVGKDIDLFFNASALRREEITWTRVEYGGGVGLHKYFKGTATDLSVRYNYQVLHALDVSGPTAPEGITNSSVGAIITEMKHDRRDNPLYPRQGYKVFASLELASDYLGGDVNYQRVELSTAWHHPLGGGRSIALGFSHGVILSIGSASEDLPFNKRFFPGGQNSIRGYQEGEASPRNATDEFVGAETYTLGTVEFEQAITPKWSFVLFSDNLGFSRSANDYPFDTGLFSVGGGLRWKTIIGPVRVEYGYNLNPRPKDPVGTLHFSLGFPF